jgi:glyoxalase family protein
MIESISSTDVQPWTKSQVPPEHSLRGFTVCQWPLNGYEGTAKLLTEAFGYRLVQEAGNRDPFRCAGRTGGGQNDRSSLHCGSQPPRITAGSVHHIHFRFANDEQQNCVAGKDSRPWL